MAKKKRVAKNCFGKKRKTAKKKSYREDGLAGANSMRALLAHEFIDIAQLINLNSPT